MILLLAPLVAVVVGVLVGAPVATIVLGCIATTASAAARTGQRALAGRIIAVVPILVAASLITFLLFDPLPGDAALNSLGLQGTEEAYEAKKIELGLNDGVLVRWARWVADPSAGNFGQSAFTIEPVSRTLGRAITPSLTLMLYAQLLAVIVSVPLGLFTGWKAGKRSDLVVTATTLGLVAVPSFIVAVLLKLVFDGSGVPFFGWEIGGRVFNTFGWRQPSEGIGQHLAHAVLPVLSLAAGLIGAYVRVLRSDVVQVLQEDHIVSARAKGLSSRRILLRHVLPDASRSMAQSVALNMGALIGSTVVIELIFSINAFGSFLIVSILRRDEPALQAGVLVVAAIFALANLGADMLRAALDPRTR